MSPRPEDAPIDHRLADLLVRLEDGRISETELQQLSDTDRDRLFGAYAGVQILALAKPRNDTHDQYDTDDHLMISEETVRHALEAQGRYRIVRHVGQGGMGSVFEASDTQLGRPVAIKVLAREGSLHEELMARERTILAALRHPHIVSIYDSGVLPNGRPFVVMELVQGETLDRYAATHPKDIVRLIFELATAVGVAHSLGVVHRDIKPQNVLVTTTGEIRVLDFGLAKRVNERALTNLPSARSPDATGTLGTRGYMSPEQSRGERVDQRADVYSLGVILDQLLRKQDRDLSAIVQKCTATSLETRYRDANDLAEDLKNWLQLRPVLARSVPTWARLKLWVRRQPTLAGLILSATLIAITFPAAVVGGILISRLTTALQETETARDQAVRSRDRAEEAEYRVREGAYYHKVLLANEEWRESQVKRARELLQECSAEFRGWEWNYLSQLCEPRTVTFPHHAQLEAIAASPDGKWLATGSHDTLARIWDTKTHALRTTLSGHTQRIYRVAFSPDSKVLVTASSDGLVKLWDVATGTFLRTFATHTGGARSALFSPDGRWLASAGKDGRVLIGDPMTGEIRQNLEGVVNGHDHPLAFANCGEWLVYACTVPIRVWESRTGKLVMTLPGPTATTVRGLSVDPSGKLLAVIGAEKKIQVWDLANPKSMSLLEITGLVSTGHAVAWNPDGSLLASSGVESVITLWDPRSGSLVHQLRGHESRISGLAWSPDGKRLYSTSADRTARGWDTQTFTGFRKLAIGSNVSALAWSLDNREIWIASDKQLTSWNSHTGQFRFRIVLTNQRRPIALAVSPDGNHIALGGADSVITLVNTQTGTIETEFAGPQAVVQVVQFSPDSRYLAAADRSRGLKIWDCELKREIPAGDSVGPYGAEGWKIGSHSLVSFINSVPTTAQVNHGVAWHPNGTQLASWVPREEVVIWDTMTGEEKVNLRGHKHGVNSISWSSDGQRLATGSSDQTVRIWDPRAGQQTLVLRNFSVPVTAVAWSPDSRSLAAAGGDGTIMIWVGAPSPTLN